MNEEIKELKQENESLRKELDVANENIDMLLRGIRNLKHDKEVREQTLRKIKDEVEYIL